MSEKLRGEHSLSWIQEFEFLLLLTSSPLSPCDAWISLCRLSWKKGTLNTSLQNRQLQDFLWSAALTTEYWKGWITSSISLTDRLIIGHSLSYLAFSCLGTLETRKEVMRMRKEDLFPRLCMWRCGGMAMPHITAACGAFYPCMKNRQESENEILLRVTQPPVDISEDFQELHSTHVGTSAHLWDTGHSINKTCFHEPVCTSACYQGALADTRYPSAICQLRRIWEGLLLTLGSTTTGGCDMFKVLVILMLRFNCV